MNLRMVRRSASKAPKGNFCTRAKIHQRNIGVTIARVQHRAPENKYMGYLYESKISAKFNRPDVKRNRINPDAITTLTARIRRSHQTREILDLIPLIFIMLFLTAIVGRIVQEGIFFYNIPWTSACLIVSSPKILTKRPHHDHLKTAH